MQTIEASLAQKTASAVTMLFIHSTELSCSQLKHLSVQLTNNWSSRRDKLTETRIKVPLFNRCVVQNAPTDVVKITQQQPWPVDNHFFH